MISLEQPRHVGDYRVSEDGDRRYLSEGEQTYQTQHQGAEQEAVVK